MRGNTHTHVYAGEKNEWLKGRELEKCVRKSPLDIKAQYLVQNLTALHGTHRANIVHA